MRPEDRAGIYLSKSFLRHGLEANPRVLQTKDPPKAGFAAPWQWSMISGRGAGRLNNTWEVDSSLRPGLEQEINSQASGAFAARTSCNPRVSVQICNGLPYAPVSRFARLWGTRGILA